LPAKQRIKSGIEMAAEKQFLHLRHIWLRFATLKEIGNEKYFLVPASLEEDSKKKITKDRIQ
jgi:hypothetical protein